MKKFPKVYYQMKAMVKICKRLRETAKDRLYVDMLVAELEERCENLELEALDDDFTGELEDFAETEIDSSATKAEADSDAELEDELAEAV